MSCSRNRARRQRRRAGGFDAWLLLAFVTFPALQETIELNTAFPCGICGPADGGRRGRAVWFFRQAFAAPFATTPLPPQPHARAGLWTADRPEGDRSYARRMKVCAGTGALPTQARWND